jgi:hypothetical protein
MAEDTRRLLKVFGVSVTDFEDEAARLVAAADALSAASGPEQVAELLTDVADLCRELNMRWLETTQHIFAAQNQLLARCAEVARKLQGKGRP